MFQFFKNQIFLETDTIRHQLRYTLVHQLMGTFVGIIYLIFLLSLDSRND